MMRLKSEKYSIAWFKLAELVSRKEKERALGLYRLLFHALEDKALGYQLEGDLLFAFSDKEVVKSYYKAAALYERDMKLTNAASLYESLHALSPEKIEYSIKLLDLYKQINNFKKIEESIKALLYTYVLNQSWIHIDSFIKKEIEHDQHKKYFIYLCSIIIDSYSKDKKYKFKYYLDKILELYKNKNNFDINKDEEIQGFLFQLKSRDDKYYKLACDIIENFML